MTWLLRYDACVEIDVLNFLIPRDRSRKSNTFKVEVYLMEVGAFLLILAGMIAAYR